MDKRVLALAVVLLALMLAVGFKVSYTSGIQPGYFEKAEAPAYGVGGDVKVEGISDKAQEYYKGLYGSE
jgi:hypothetical protein